MTITAGPEALAARLDTTDTVAAAVHEHFLPARGRRPSCSASQPSVVAGMLEALNVERGQQVLEMRAELAAGPLVCLQVGSDRTARGQAGGMRVGFMELRAQRTPGASWSALRYDDPTIEPALTDVDPFTALLHEASRWAIAISVPSCHYDLEKRTNERGHGVVSPRSRTGSGPSPHTGNRSASPSQSRRRQSRIKRKRCMT